MLGSSPTVKLLRRGVALAGLGICLASCFVDGAGEGTLPQACKEPSDCPDDDNVCTEATCLSGFCHAAAVPDGLALTNEAGDCKTARCEAGVLLVEDDPSDVDDGDPCTADACAVGGATHTPTPGEPCLVGEGHGICSEDGNCDIECSASTPCEEIVCQTVKCIENVCVYEDGDEVPEGTVDEPLDCMKPACVDGALGMIEDPTDVPMDDGIECTAETCEAGVPSHPPEPIDTPCGTGQVCDGAGACVACTPTTACPLANGECAYQTCEANACVDQTVAAGMPCHVTTTNLCSAAGACVECLTTFDCTDPLPPCRVHTCSLAGACGQAFAMVGTPCGTNGHCCMNGSCAVGPCP